MHVVQVPKAFVEGLDLVTDVDKGELSVLVHGSPAAKGLKVTNLVFLWLILPDQVTSPCLFSHHCCQLMAAQQTKPSRR